MNRRVSTFKFSYNHVFIFLIVAGIAITGCGQKDNTTQVRHTETPDSVYVAAGNRIVAATFDTLRNALTNAMQSGGAEGAISFCSEKASALTSTFADTVQIRRAALRYRNPMNKPDSLEQRIFTTMESELSADQVPSPRIVRMESLDEVHFFKPIILQPMCMTCHGQPGRDIQPATAARIIELYPADSAVNFQTGDLRGIWHILFRTGS